MWSAAARLRTSRTHDQEPVMPLTRLVVRVIIERNNSRSPSLLSLWQQFAQSLNDRLPHFCRNPFTDKHQPKNGDKDHCGLIPAQQIHC